jgi:hypothetical protein
MTSHCINSLKTAFKWFRCLLCDLFVHLLVNLHFSKISLKWARFASTILNIQYLKFQCLFNMVYSSIITAIGFMWYIVFFSFLKQTLKWYTYPAAEFRQASLDSTLFLDQLEFLNIIPYSIILFPFRFRFCLNLVSLNCFPISIMNIPIFRSFTQFRCCEFSFHFV